MFLQLFKFEWRYHFKQLSFYIFSTLFFFLGFYMSFAGSLGETDLVNSNAPYQISFFTGVFSLGAVFAIMFFCIQAIIRDRNCNIEGIIYSSPVKKRELYWSRFLGAFLISLLCYSLIVVGFCLGTFFTKNPEKMAAFEPYHYLHIWSILVLPNLFILTAILFSLAALSRKALIVYLGAIMVYALYWGCSIFFNSPMLAQAVPPSPQNMEIAALLDPFGLSAFFEQTMYWTPFQKNNELPAYTGFLLWNRIIWICIAVILLVLTYKNFSFMKGSVKVKKVKKIDTPNVDSITYIPVLTSVTSKKAKWLHCIALIKLELASIIKSLPFMTILLLWLVIAVTEIYGSIVDGGTYHESLLPATYLLIGLISEPLPFLGLIIIIFYSGELVWKERSFNFHEIIDATPVANAMLFLSKYVALLLLPLLLIVVGIVVAITFQILGNYQDFKWYQYMGMFYFNGTELLFYGILALFIQYIMPNKYLGMVLSGVLIFLLGSSLSSIIGIEHPLLQLGRTFLVSYVDMNGYGSYLYRFHWSAVYWMSLAGILVFLAYKLLRRGEHSTLNSKIGSFFTGWKKGERIFVIGFFFFFIGSGSVIFYNSNVTNKYISTNDQLDLAEAYERKFKKYDNLKELYPIDLKTEVAIYPNLNKYTVNANYILENKSSELVDKIFISPREPLDSVSIEGAILVASDEQFGTFLFELKSPLGPGERIHFQYNLTVVNDGFETRKDIVNNGSYILHSSFTPSLGYRPSMELKDPLERKRRGLPKRPIETGDEKELHGKPYNRIGKLNFETIVSTNSDQIAIAPGKLIRKWTQNNRNYYHYKPRQKVTPLLGYFSAGYKVHEDTYRGINIEQYYHPEHEMNIASVAKASRQTLEYCIQNFGSYPYAHIRIAEIPAYWPFGGQALPGTISMVEDQFYLIKQSNARVFDLVAKRTIHEIAHQWWGHILTPKITYGGGFFMEGLAKYTEAVIMEKKYGKGALWNLSEYSNNRYFTERSYSTKAEPPVYLSDGESYLLYGKDYTVMLALKELVGEAKINTVLKKIVEQYGDKDEFEVTTLHFLEEVYRITPKKYHELINDWFKKIITYDLKVKNSFYKKLSDGRYGITLEVETKRFETINTGEDVEIEINEPIQIGLFHKHPKDVGAGEEVLHLQDYNFNTNQSKIYIVVDRLPNYVSIDPYGTRLDKNRVDNIKKL
ncbi:ABC transporter permease/M1 family aminopeptidase [Aquimarina brevivitae]|uniref:ABC-type transport system involved in multi-copper enzyme maturation permease subunit n=1 Tax=Aquimarina brevivitae TaxID=323412 RepID=A0A4Q7PFT2_9FLAO|nr:M1 family aminopeptidase [Aquimarina brevivitae]RZS99373.1 ABC-type transport system involved in multi-copper enzyme maturation permease subunit [Aquimarina brevivitae]